MSAFPRRSASGNGAANFFNPAGAPKDQFDRKYAPLYRAEALRDADRAASRELYKVMMEISKDSNYIRNTDPESVKVFKAELASLLSSGGSQELQKIAESAVRQLLDRKKKADAESDEMRKQMDALQKAAFEIWPSLRYMVETEITTFIERYNEADRRSRDYFNQLAEKDATIRALQQELVALKSLSKAGESSQGLEKEKKKWRLESSIDSY
jgi:hypothetical protein